MNYVDLRLGDSLPTVGVLQLLLNGYGIRVAVDGTFGPRTLEGVKAFQSKNRLWPDGIVGERTWTRLTADVNLPIVDAVDVFDPTFATNDASYIRKVGGNVLLTGGECNGVEDVVRRVLQAGRNVFLLRFHGHGLPGIASISSGEDALDPINRADIFASRRIMRILAPLRHLFGPYGSIQFIECQTGGGGAGHKLLGQLSQQLGVPVTGAVLDQPFGRTWSFRLMGPTRTSVPGHSSLRHWCQSLPPFVCQNPTTPGALSR